MGPAPGLRPGMGAEPALAAEGKDVVVGVVFAQPLLRLRPELVDPREIQGAEIVGERIPGWAVEDFHNVGLAVKPWPVVRGHLDGDLGDFPPGGLPDLRRVQLLDDGPDFEQRRRRALPGNGGVAGHQAPAREIGYVVVLRICFHTRMVGAFTEGWIGFFVFFERRGMALE